MTFNSTTVKHFVKHPDQLAATFYTLAAATSEQVWCGGKVQGIKVLTLAAAPHQKMEAEATRVECLLTTRDLIKRLQRLLKAAKILNQDPHFEGKDNLKISLRSLAQQMEIFAEVPPKYQKIQREIFGILSIEGDPAKSPMRFSYIPSERHLECPGCHKQFDPSYLMELLRDEKSEGWPCCGDPTLCNSVFEEVFGLLVKSDIEVPHFLQSSRNEGMLHHVIQYYDGTPSNLFRMVRCLMDQGYSFENMTATTRWVDGLPVQRPLFSFLRAERGGIEIANYVLEQGQRLSLCMHEKTELRGVEERTLHWWAREGESEMLIWSIDRGADPTVIGYKECDLWTTINSKAIEPLVRAGICRVSVKGLLHILAEGSKEDIDAVIRHGDFGRRLNITKRYGGSRSIYDAAHNAVEEGNVNFLKNLLRCGYRIPKPWPCEMAQHSVLLEALQKRQDEMVVYLLEKGFRHPDLMPMLREGNFPKAAAWAKENL